MARSIASTRPAFPSTRNSTRSSSTLSSSTSASRSRKDDRADSIARSTRRRSGTGCTPCVMNKLATIGSSQQRSRIASAPSPSSSRSVCTIRRSARPCKLETTRTSSSASARAPVVAGSAAKRSRSVSTRLLAASRSMSRYDFSGERRVDALDRSAASHVHVHAARQTRIETAHRAHNVDALEILRAVFFENRRVLHRVFVRARGAEAIAWIRIPRRRRPRLVILDLAVAYHHMVREYAAHCLGKADADRFFRNFERLPRLRFAFGEQLEGLVDRI